MLGGSVISGRVSWWAAAVLLAAACGPASVGAETASAPPTAQATAVSQPAAALPGASIRPGPAADQSLVEAVLGDHFFDPQVIVVKVGTTVRWINASGTHDVTARDGSFRSPTLGVSYSRTFTKAGRYPFFCSYHPGEMTGEVVVEPAN